MSIIRTKRNLVAAYEPLPGDVAVVTRLGSARGVRPIAQYDAAVADACALADLMEYPVDVFPVDVDDLLKLHGMTPAEFVRGLSAQARAELRQDCINACWDALYNCDDAAVRAQAVEVLVTLGVLRCERG